ncbi:hypothetical protein WG902_12975 [Ramlibacter sp. PS3R-8]|uniref:hypothetical protein n=1 Tax=Ramlibacter sp. PS3R-8 TaxID=3133437 RepID=UPI0030A96CE7
MYKPQQQIRRKLHAMAVTALAASLLCVVAGEAAAGAEAAQGALHVSAVVRRHASVRMNAPQSLTISESDVQRGYVDVASPMEVTVRSNVPEGYILALQNQGEQVREAVVHGLAAPMVVNAGGGSLARPAPRNGLWTDTLELRVRFQLSPTARPGIHAWPLTVSMMGM